MLASALTSAAAGGAQKRGGALAQPLWLAGCHETLESGVGGRIGVDGDRHQGSIGVEFVSRHIRIQQRDARGGRHIREPVHRNLPGIDLAIRRQRTDAIYGAALHAEQEVGTDEHSGECHFDTRVEPVLRARLPIESCGPCRSASVTGRR